MLTVLFSVKMPETCYETLKYIMQMTNLDTIDTTSALNYMFHFRETDPFNKTFNDAGYNTTNFFIESGALFFLVCIFIIWVPIRKLLQCIGNKSKANNCLVRKMKQDPNFKMVIVRFVIESCIELGLSSLICIVRIDKEDFAKPWEGISTSCAALALLVLILAPIHLMIAICKF